MLAAPEFVVAERIELLDQIEVAAELQHRVLADRMMRGEEGAEFQACHGVSLRNIFGVTWLVLVLSSGPPAGYGAATAKAIAEASRDAVTGRANIPPPGIFRLARHPV